MLRLRRAALVLSAVAALSAACPVDAADANPAQWQASDDDSLLFDVRLGQYRLGDGVRGYQTPEGICVNFVDVVQALDVPIKLDKTKQIAEGWAFEERNHLTVDRMAGKIRLADRQQSLAPGAIYDTPEGWCASVKMLSAWFGIELRADMSNAVLFISSKTKLPVELAEERRARAARLRPTPQLDLAKLPQAKLPYRLWRTPSLDAVVTVGGLSDRRQGKRFDRKYDLYASGEVATLSVDASLSSDQKGIPQYLRARGYRTDPAGGLLGPLHATHFEMGDVISSSSPLVTQSIIGRGAMVTNRPVDRPETFDRKTFRGDLPTGWDAELYRNGQLLGVAQNRTDGRYEFADVPLLFGQNIIEIVLYGPQGQVRRQRETMMIGPESIPPRQAWYWASVSQDQRDLMSWRVDPMARQRGWRGVFGVERGIDQKTSVSAQLSSMVLEDERLTYVEGAVRRSVGFALFEVGGAMEKGGGHALRAQALAQIGSTSVNAESIMARNFYSDRVYRDIVGSHTLSLEHSFDLGKVVLPVHLAGRYVQRRDGNDALEGEARLSTSIRRVSITAEVDWRRNRLARERDPPDLVDATLYANGSIGKTRIRGEARWRLSPESRFESASLIGERRLGEFALLRGELGYDHDLGRVRAAVGYVRQYDKLLLSATGEAASDGSVAVGVNLAFSLGPDPRGRGIRVASQKLATSGSVLARVFRDDNSDGIRQAGEDYERDVQLMVARSPVKKMTDAHGEVIIDGLEPHHPVLIGVDASSLPDPLVQPAGPGMAVTPRAGVATIIDLPLVGAGEILGTLVGAGGDPIEGVDLELVGPRNVVAATVRTDFDGFFLFESVPYGSYQLRITRLSATAANIGSDLQVRATIGKSKPSARLGRVVVGAQAQPRLAYQDVLLEDRGKALVLAR